MTRRKPAPAARPAGNGWVLLAGLGAGALLPLSLAPFGYWFLAPVAVAVLYALLERYPQRLITLGCAFGVGKYAVGVSWVYFSIHDYGNASVFLAVGLVALFVVGLTLLFTWTQFVALALCYRWVSSPLSRRLGFGALWVLWEWLQTWVLTGFPWLFVGAGQIDSPFGGYAPLGGVLLVSAAVVTAALAVQAALQFLAERSVRPALVALTLLAMLPLGGVFLGQLVWVELEAPRSVALVQGNVDQATKWRPENRRPILDRYVDLTEPHWGRDLIIWPEASITLLEHQAADWLKRWDRQGQANGTTLVLGLPSIERNPAAEDGYYFHNLALALGAGSGRYQKRRLVPFGEYVPLAAQLRGVIDFFDLPMSRAQAGPLRQPLLDLDGIPAALAICYEIAYPDLVGADAAQARVLLTISNDAWFGSSIGPHQHLELARMRALETGRYLLRATNNGITAIVDHRGQVVDSLAQFQPGVLTGEFRPASGVTPFARLGSLPALGLVVLALAAMVFLRAPKTPGAGH